ncbi:GH25 family lysozyme [Caproicibacter fermentans]|uniref:Ig-like domain-containing protein n=1 Tax=Caproicibacter fermentans TaxID=2576756 RepID=A0A7G8TD32_9FIRM|nr:GH25 family lysozyme [Caproicibacter fermentans]QNK41523.1 Ig-like domain-containing protein [Caproicibacter fermentans]
MKKKILALILVVSGMILMSFPTFAADNSSGGFQLNESSIGVRVGDYTTLCAYFGSSVDTDVTWTSADSTIATVDSQGQVTGKKIGQTIVTATTGAYSASCVVNVAYKGIDVSRYQGTVDWAAVKNYGIDFAMIRTGFGSENWSTQTDPYFETNYSNAKANGLKVGAYHYSYATSVEMAETEADFCLHILNGRQLDYPVAYDVEDKDQWGLSTDTLGQMVQAFCSKLEAAGYKTVVYSYYSFYKAHLTSPLVAQYDTWIAHSTDMTSFSPYTMWQYGQRSVPGVSGSCDVDYSFYDYSGSGSGSGDGITTPTVPDSSEQNFTCDTTGTYTFGTNSIYYYKITTNDTFTPSASSSNPAAVSVSYSKRLTDGFLYKITNNGPGEAVITTTAGNGTAVSFTAVGSGTSTVSTPQDNSGSADNGGTLKCDTTASYTFGSNHSYIYKIYSTGSTAPTATSSNPSAVTVSYYGKTSGGYLFKITNAGTGAAVITTKDASGASASFTANGTLQSSAPVSTGTLKCDTTASYTFGSNNSYIYKIYSTGSTAPTATSSNPSAVAVSYYGKASDGYLFKITNAGTGAAVITTKDASGASASFTANGTLSGQVPAGIRSDTPYLFTMSKGKTYMFKFTPASGNPVLHFNTGNSSVIQSVSVTQSGGSYFYQIRAAGSGQAGVYAAEQGKSAQRLSIVTVS